MFNMFNHQPQLFFIKYIISILNVTVHKKAYSTPKPPHTPFLRQYWDIQGLNRWNVLWRCPYLWPKGILPSLGIKGELIFPANSLSWGRVYQLCDISAELYDGFKMWVDIPLRLWFNQIHFNKRNAWMTKCIAIFYSQFKMSKTHVILLLKSLR